MVLWDLLSNFLFVYLGSAASGPRHICDIIDLPTKHHVRLWQKDFSNSEYIYIFF
jgi:hypothetical protein